MRLPSTCVYQPGAASGSGASFAFTGITEHDELEHKCPRDSHFTTTDFGTLCTWHHTYPAQVCNFFSVVSYFFFKFAVQFSLLYQPREKQWLNLAFLVNASLWSGLSHPKAYMILFPQRYEALKCKIVIIVNYQTEKRNPTVNNSLFYTLNDRLSIISSHRIKEGLKQGANRGQNTITWKNLVICGNLEKLNKY